MRGPRVLPVLSKNGGDEGAELSDVVDGGRGGEGGGSPGRGGSSNMLRPSAGGEAEGGGGVENPNVNLELICSLTVPHNS